MEKIIVNPLEVRGLGNVVSPKTIEDFEVYNSSLSFEDNVYTLEYSPGTVSVALTVSSGSISVGESIVLEAIVTDDGTPLSDVSVRFVSGNQVLGTEDTDSNGECSLTVSDLSVGSYSIYASAKGKSSSPVSVTVSKLTSSITLSVPASGTVGTSYTVSGTLVPTTGSVKLYENSVLKDTLTVSSGSFSKAITQSNEGTYSYYAVFEGSSTYSSVTSSTGSIVVSDVPPVPVVTSVGLSADKSILSYADSESATLSATVLDQSSQPMSGVTVTFYNGSTSMGTADTNSSGVATKSYASTGAGDLSFTAVVGTISSETYAVEDCLYYNTDEVSRTTTQGSTIYDNNLSQALPTNCEISFDVWSNNSSSGGEHRYFLLPKSQFSSGTTQPTYGLFFDAVAGANCKFGKRDNNSTVNIGSKFSMTMSAEHTVKFVKTGNLIEFYLDDSLKTSSTESWIGNYSDYCFSMIRWSTSGTSKIKNVKFKPL